MVRTGRGLLRQVKSFVKTSVGRGTPLTLASLGREFFEDQLPRRSRPGSSTHIPVDILSDSTSALVWEPLPLTSRLKPLFSLKFFVSIPSTLLVLRTWGDWRVHQVPVSQCLRDLTYKVLPSWTLSRVVYYPRVNYEVFIYKKGSGVRQTEFQGELSDLFVQCPF